MNEKRPLDNVVGVVTQHVKGKHGLYVVAHSDQVKTKGRWITFDLNAWKEDPLQISAQTRHQGAPKNL